MDSFEFNQSDTLIASETRSRAANISASASTGAAEDMSLRAVFRGLAAEPVRSGLRSWFRSAPTRPFVVPGLLPLPMATAIRRELEAVDVWEREHWIWSDRRDVDPCSDAAVAQTDADGFAAAARAFSLNDVLPDEQCEEHPALSQLRRLMVVATAGELAGYCESIVGAHLCPVPIWQVARYARGDFLSPHTDSALNRQLGLVLYFSAPDGWEREFGGRFGYRNENGHVWHVNPSFNSAVFLPFRPDCEHWVEPIAAAEATRYSIALHFVPPLTTGQLA